MILFKVNSKSSIYVRLLYSMAVLCLLTALSSCSDDDAPAEIIPNPDSEIYFTDSLNFTSDSGEAILSFTTNKDWSIDVSQSAVMSVGVRCSLIKAKLEKTKYRLEWQEMKELMTVMWY